jgi:hypothetical protein
VLVVRGAVVSMGDWLAEADEGVPVFPKSALVSSYRELGCELRKVVTAVWQPVRR